MSMRAINGLAVLLVLALVPAQFAPRASAAEPTGWRLHVCEPDKPCELRGKTLGGPTACALDLASLVSVLPSATKISCVRVEADQVGRR